MKNIPALLALILCLTTVNDAAAEKYEICLWPRSCAPKPQKPKTPPQKPAPLPEGTLYVGKDPVSATIMQGSLAAEDGGIVSAIRVGKGSKILYLGKGNLALPASSIPAEKTSKPAVEEKEWKTVKSGGEAAKQINGMKAHRKSLTGEIGEAKSGSDRMWGDKKK